MKKTQIIELIMAILIAIIPTLWIKDFVIINPVWWTVILAWNFGVLFGEWKERNK